MVAIEEEQFTEIILPEPPRPVDTTVDLKGVGFLGKHSMYINCPACLAESLSVVRLEVVTCWQKFLRATNLCKTSERRFDINHYCGICGCYIGRWVPLSCMERCISRQARKKAAHDAMTLKTKPRDCAEHMQKARERIKENRTKDRAQRRAADNGNKAND